jgi:hypothetical protein
MMCSSATPTDRERVERLRAALTARGLRVFFDESDIEHFQSITARFATG